jgi:phosphonate transport system substrate-binding protein
LDSAALTIVEYRQMADEFDSTQILAGTAETGTEQYVLLAKRNGELQQLRNLRGRRLCALKAPKMCVASAWLSTILNEARLGPSEQFFASMTTDIKASSVILPVFFGQTDVCLTSKRSFDTICEMNPQVAKALAVVASSPPMVVTFYVFHKNFPRARREKLIGVLSSVRSSAAGLQLATLFQFDDLMVRDASCLAGSLDVLRKAERTRTRQAAVRKG